jgi:site-specific DNA-cytosine methylase
MKWAPLIPLIGGMPLGAEKALGTPPQFIASYTGFWENDRHYYHYQNNVLGRSIPYINLSEDSAFTADLDLVVMTPPCAGLSSLNTGKSVAVKGAGCQKNEWMYVSARDAITRFNAKILIGENAPALYTTKGKPVADALYRIASEFGYSLTLFRTNTILHGIPQLRDRTFYILSKGNCAKVLPYVNNRYDGEIADYLKLIPSEASLQNDLIDDRFPQNNPYWNFLKYKYPTEDIRLKIHEDGTTSSHFYIVNNSLLQEFYDWSVETNDIRGLRYSKRTIDKMAQGLGVWDISVAFYKEHTKAVITKNISCAVHPSEDRSYNFREMLHLMAFPHDFEFLPRKSGKYDFQIVTQNVPVCTAEYVIREATRPTCHKVCSPLGESSYVKQNNIVPDIEVINNSSLSDFFS